MMPLAGRGVRVMGARTMSSDPDWRFVNVRRLLLMIEKAISSRPSGRCSSRTTGPRARRSASRSPASC